MTMKKKILALSAIALMMGATAMFCANKPIAAYAEEPVVTETEPTENTEAEAQETEPVYVFVPIQEAKDAWTRFADEYLTADKVAMYMSWVAYIGTIIGLAANLAKLKKAAGLTTKQVSEQVQAKIEEVVSKEISEQTGKLLPSVLATQEKTNEMLAIFSKIIALGQENTPESRVAILNLIEELGTVGKETLQATEEAIHEEVKAVEEHKAEVEAKLDEIIEEYDGTSI